jgi:hypothetical protein
MTVRYSALPELALTDWDGEVEAVFSPRAAQTHLLSAAACTVLRALIQCPHSVDAQTLATLIDRDAAIDAESEQMPRVDSQFVQQLLDGLYSAGLTQRHE